jgi:hypothetical protein
MSYHLRCAAASTSFSSDGEWAFLEHSAGGQIRRGHTGSKIWLDLRGFIELADPDAWAAVLLVKRYGDDAKDYRQW